MIYTVGVHTVYTVYRMHMALKTRKNLERLTSVEDTPPWSTWRWSVSKLDGFYIPLSMDCSVVSGILGNKKDCFTPVSPKRIPILFIKSSSKDYLCLLQIKIRHLVRIVQHIMAKIKYIQTHRWTNQSITIHQFGKYPCHIRRLVVGAILWTAIFVIRYWALVTFQVLWMLQKASILIPWRNKITRTMICKIDSYC